MRETPVLEYSLGGRLILPTRKTGLTANASTASYPRGDPINLCRPGTVCPRCKARRGVLLSLQIARGGRQWHESGFSITLSSH